MNNLIHKKNYATFLFKADKTQYCSSFLAEFLAFIKSQKISLPFTFSYVGDETNLLPEISLNENIMIDFSTNSLTNEKINQFEEYLNLTQNFYVNKLYEKLTERDVKTSEATPEMKKIASLIKALTRDSEYIFLENPEKDLSENIRILFYKALQTHLENKQINAFIYTQNEEMWLPDCAFTVSRNKYFQFHIESTIVDTIPTRKVA